MAREMGPYLKFLETRHKTCNVKLVNKLLLIIYSKAPQVDNQKAKMQAISLNLSQNMVVKAINDQFCS